ncbi:MULTISPECIES: Rrf2 family transcriptional regulator [unclassified Lactobacillus]|uniref:Rrf2 family transcriptional regulator n=1 Tax=unclassified Lactobacillus TaxID=2620435 RepID=UPI000BEEEE6B|nr:MULTISPECIES: Rrf2 family transcriptional regulator [unclassified Lactobacillus]PEG86696.1 transcriptional regulator [Lactobacillus sp. UMNPBX14]PEH02245.1 transcriptional regulator [Lactobacillus sp. UMNPBX6]
MRISTKFSDAIHILSFIYIYKNKIQLSSDNIARSVEISPVMVRKLMSQLKKAGLLETTHGSANPQLARPTEDISLLDIFLAVEDNHHLFTIDYETNPQCIVGGNIQTALEKYYNEAEIAAKAKLDQTKLADVINTILINEKEKRH